MPTFRYSAYAISGVIERGVIEGGSRGEALETLSRRGLTVFEAEEQGGSQSGPPQSALFSRRPLGLSDLALFTRELATLLEAELPIDESLRLLRDESERPRVKSLAAELAEDVTSGRPLSIAFDVRAYGAPAVCTSLIRAGEAQGSLAAALTELATLLERRLDLQGRVRSALVYPAVLVVVALISVVVMVAVLVPALAPIFEDAGAAMPPALALARHASALLSNDGQLILLGAAAALLALRAIARLPAARLRLDGLLLRLPILGPVQRKMSVSLLAQTLGALLRSGVPIAEALDITAAAMPRAMFAKQLRESRQRVIEGERLSATLASFAHFPQSAIRLLVIGEETSRLDRMLQHIADVYAKDAGRQIERAMTLLSPALTIVIGLIVGGLMLSVVQAIMGVNTLALR